MFQHMHSRAHRRLPQRRQSTIPLVDDRGVRGLSGNCARDVCILYLKRLKTVISLCQNLRLSVDCLFLRSPSRVLYRTELIPRAPKGRRTRTPHPHQFPMLCKRVFITNVPMLDYSKRIDFERLFPIL